MESTHLDEGGGTFEEFDAAEIEDLSHLDDSVEPDTLAASPVRGQVEQEIVGVSPSSSSEHKRAMRKKYHQDNELNNMLYDMGLFHVDSRPTKKPKHRRS